MRRLTQVSVSYYDVGRITHSADQRTQAVTDDTRPAVRRQPIARDSRLVPRPGVGHEADPEGAGQVLVVTATGVRHPISRAAGELFDALDGRRLDEIRPDLVIDPAGAIDVLELLRRLRALDLIEDVDDPATPGD